MHSDDKEERRSYLSDLARLKKIRARHKKANSSALLQNQVSYKRASIYEIDAEGNTTGIEEEKIFALQKEPKKELDIAIARKDYKDYIKQQEKEAEKRELQIFPIKREEKKETKFEIRRINRTWSSDGYVTGSWKRNHDNATVT